MIERKKYYDVSIVGGGLAGLSAAIVLAKKKYRVILFEKETYPFHKVCGEYISLESIDFLQSLGLPLAEWDLPQITELQVSSPSGNLLQQTLPLGGFGISRYRIDYELLKIAEASGVQIHQDTRVQDVQYIEDGFDITTSSGMFHSKICCCAFGKRANLDIKWKRPFVQKNNGPLNNLIGIKYHAQLDHSRNTISLHNFKDGYCGISPIEEDKTCICYLTTADNLRSHGNNIHTMERAVLFNNPFLRDAFSAANFLYDKPLTISQISFEKKEQVMEHILFLGDASGMITPLCGNGMSMALLGSKMACVLIGDFLDGSVARQTMESSYASQWKAAFANRLFAGRMIQSVFGKTWLTAAFVGTMKIFPGLSKSIIRQTHG